MPKIITYEFVKESFEKEGYELLNKEYINAHSKLDYICPNGHKHSISWSNWKKSSKCPYCVGNGRLNMEFVRSKFAEENYILLTTKYKNNKQKLEYICSKGHKDSISWNNWKTGNRCPICSRKKGDAKKRTSLEFVRSEFEKEGYKLLSKEYRNNRQKLNYICPKGHRHSISWGEWNNLNSRCPYCANCLPININFVRSEFTKENYILLSDKYINNYSKLEYICSKSHKHSISWSSWQQGHRCPECISMISKGEVQVRNFIESLGVKILSNNRNQIFNPETGKGLELDIFMPTLNKAIEYNGEYWHRDKSRDLFKQQLCESRGINLLTIWEKEWFNNSRECKEKIMKFMF